MLAQQASVNEKDQYYLLLSGIDSQNSNGAFDGGKASDGVLHGVGQMSQSAWSQRRETEATIDSIRKATTGEFWDEEGPILVSAEVGTRAVDLITATYWQFYRRSLRWEKPTIGVTSFGEIHLSWDINQYSIVVNVNGSSYTCIINRPGSPPMMAGKSKAESAETIADVIIKAHS